MHTKVTVLFILKLICLLSFLNITFVDHSQFLIDQLFVFVSEILRGNKTTRQGEGVGGGIPSHGRELFAILNFNLCNTVHTKY